MQVKNFLISFCLLFFFTIFPQHALAQEKASDSSASFAEVLQLKEADTRVGTLEEYLTKYHSPLAQFAGSFIAQADFYHIDWRMVAAISGVESTFANAEPFHCYNSWGYGIYGNHILCFNSYDEAIHTISKSLREQYMNKWGAQDVYDIGHFYAASPTWASRVDYFMQDIEKYKKESDSQTLPISL